MSRYTGGLLTTAIDAFGGDPTRAVEYLVVAGGGAGGSSRGGGGGAGGLLTSAGYIVTSGITYTVTVGAGGNQNQNAPGTGGNGGNSEFGIGAAVYTAATSGLITCYGGGGGGGDGPAASPGGSGGGGGNESYGHVGGTGTPGQGFAGGGSAGPSGAGGPGGPESSGGGGGAGSAGVSVPGTGGLQRSGNGGAGILSTISGAAIQYAGGGGGGGAYVTQSNSYNSNKPNGWGVAGGGHGGHTWNSPTTALSLVPTTARINSGSGGGGGTFSPYGPWSYGTAGASGTVIIRYLSTFPLAASVTGSPQTYVTGPYRVYVWTQSGTIKF